MRKIDFLQIDLELLRKQLERLPYRLSHQLDRLVRFPEILQNQSDPS